MSVAEAASAAVANRVSEGVSSAATRSLPFVSSTPPLGPHDATANESSPSSQNGKSNGFLFPLETFETDLLVPAASRLESSSPPSAPSASPIRTCAASPSPSSSLEESNGLMPPPPSETRRPGAAGVRVASPTQTSGSVARFIEGMR
ncbi:unnamed protein product, partial [Ectocarpus sp. 12 AP-2014]